MFRFLLIFFLLYGGLHGYAFWKIKAAFSPCPTACITLAAIMIFMTAAPILLRILEQNGLEAGARILSWIGYVWMGILFLFFCISLICDVCRLLLFLLQPVGFKEALSLGLSARQAFIFPFLLALGIFTYGWFEARNIRVEHLTVKTEKISPNRGRLRLAQISDVHIGLMIDSGFVSKIIKIIRDENPDILLSTGDLVDGQINGIAGVLPVLQNFKPRLGKYAVTGNHEFYAGISDAEDFTQKAGFKMLRGAGVTIDGLVNIAGVDDPAGRAAAQYRPVDEAELLTSLPSQHFTLLLKHQPILDRKTLDLFDLQLSGHTHKGQIFPFSLITRLYFPLHTGFFQISSHSSVRVSRGTGTWGPPIRFLSPPEITIIDLVPSSDLKKTPARIQKKNPEAK